MNRYKIWQVNLKPIISLQIYCNNLFFSEDNKSLWTRPIWKYKEFIPSISISQQKRKQRDKKKPGHTQDKNKGTFTFFWADSEEINNFRCEIKNNNFFAFAHSDAVTIRMGSSLETSRKNDHVIPALQNNY